MRPYDGRIDREAQMARMEGQVRFLQQRHEAHVQRQTATLTLLAALEQELAQMGRPIGGFERGSHAVLSEVISRLRLIYPIAEDEEDE